MNIKPKALEDLNEDEVIDELDDEIVTPEDDFGFTETITDL